MRSRRGRARAMRWEPTEAEEALWELLRRRAAGGWKFRRQQKIGNYVVDFFSPERKLVIEVDGRAHMKTVRQDAYRQSFLRKCGYRVIRFWNDEVISNPAGVIERITKFGSS